MKEIGMKKTTGDQLPDLESDRGIKLRYIKMADRPQCEPGKQSRASHRFQQENSDVYADQYSGEARHKTSLTCLYPFHTKVTRVSQRTYVTEICDDNISNSRRFSHNRTCEASVSVARGLT